MSYPTIAVLGLGAMGSRIAKNLLNADYPVVVWNRTFRSTTPLKQAGATLAASPRQAAEHADIIFSMVTNNEASKSVWLTTETGAINGLTEHKIAVEASTLTVDWTQELSKTVEATGASFAAAPVVGSRPQAEAKKLISLVGGALETITQIDPVLSTFSSSIHHVGSAGQGMAMKLAVNALFGIQVAAVGEILGALSQHGCTPEQVMNCLGEMPVMSPAANVAGSLIAAKKFVPMFPISLVEKDFGYACEMTVQNNMPTTAAIQQVYKDAIKKGYGEENITAIARLFL